MSRRTGSCILGRKIFLAFVTAATAGVLAPVSTLQAQQEWIRYHVTPVSDNFHDVASDGLGSLYVSGTTTYGSSFTRATLLKYDVSGNLLWSKEYGVRSLHFGLGVSADGLGNVYVAGAIQGMFAGDYLAAYVGKFDASGTQIWGRELDTPGSDTASAVTTDATGNIFISGTTDGDLGGPNAGSNDAFLSKYDGAGSLQWTRQFGTGANDVGTGVATDAMGNIYLTGSANGGAFEVGSDAFINKYDAAGSLLWTRQFGTAEIDNSSGVAVDSSGNVFLAGTTRGAIGGPNAGTSNAFLSKFAADGTQLWTQQLGTTGLHMGLDVSVDALGNAYLSGSTDGNLGGPNAGGSDAFVSKFSGAGSLQWLRQFGSITHDDASSVLPDGVGGAFVVGLTYVGGTGGGESDAYIARIIPEPASAALALAALPLSLVVRRNRRCV